MTLIYILDELGDFLTRKAEKCGEQLRYFLLVHLKNQMSTEFLKNWIRKAADFTYNVCSQFHIILKKLKIHQHDTTLLQVCITTVNCTALHEEKQAI